MRIRERLVGPPDGPRGLYLCHGFCELGAEPLVPWLRTLRDFLAANPREVVLLVIEDYVPPERDGGGVRRQWPRRSRPTAARPARPGRRCSRWPTRASGW